MLSSPGGWVFLLSPVVLGVLLLGCFPEYRRFRWRAVISYPVIMGLLIWGALAVVAHIASARIVPREILVVLWFTIAWRLAWEIWSQLVNRTLGGRESRPPGSPGCTLDSVSSTGVSGEEALPSPQQAGRGRLAGPLGVVLRAALTGAVFFSTFLIVVATHRCKLADGQDPMSTFSMPFEHIRIPTRDGLTLDGWFVPESPESDRTIIVCHGAGANKGNFVWFLGPLAHQGYNVLFFDFRAHGGSEGRTTTYGIRERADVVAAVDWLERTRPRSARTIVGLGSSQGALALALAAAEDERIDAVVLDSPFVSPRDLMRHNMGLVPVLGPAFADVLLAEASAVTGTSFFSVSAEAAVRAMGTRPVMVVHGDGDFVMPRSHAERLHAAARGPRHIWFGPGPHSNIITEAPSEYARRLFGFLGDHLGRPTRARVERSDK